MMQGSPATQKISKKNMTARDIPWVAGLPCIMRILRCVSQRYPQPRFVALSCPFSRVDGLVGNRMRVRARARLSLGGYLNSYVFLMKRPWVPPHRRLAAIQYLYRSIVKSFLSFFLSQAQYRYQLLSRATLQLSCATHWSIYRAPLGLLI